MCCVQHGTLKYMHIIEWLSRVITICITFIHIFVVRIIKIIKICVTLQ